jgi:serine/threonine-protein kinase RsbT
VEAIKGETLPARSEQDMVIIRQVVRRYAVEVGLGLVDQTKIVTAASELARNTLTHGGGGEARIEIVADGLRRGVRAVFTDRGPGIADIAQAMRDGYTSGGGMGLGLGGSKRLVDVFDLQSRPGEGTRVTIMRWK